MNEYDENQELESQIRALLRDLARFELTEGDLDVFLDRKAIWKIVDTETFLEFLDQYALPMDRTAGGGRNDKHAKKGSDPVTRRKLKEVEDELRRLLNEPPSEGRQKRIKKLKEKKNDIRKKGKPLGETHHTKGPGGYQVPGVHEEEGAPEGDDTER
jgi:hypothetical protein